MLVPYRHLEASVIYRTKVNYIYFLLSSLFEYMIQHTTEELSQLMRQSFMLRREERNSTIKSAMLPEDYITFQSTIQQCTSSPITHFFLFRELCCRPHANATTILTAKADTCLINSFNEVFPILIQHLKLQFFYLNFFFKYPISIAPCLFILSNIKSFPQLFCIQVCEMPMKKRSWCKLSLRFKCKRSNFPKVQSPQTLHMINTLPVSNIRKGF